MEVSHEEFVAVLKEKDKYEKMKENVRSENEKQEIMRLSSIKSINPMQKYPHITKFFAYTRKMLAFMFLFATNFLIFSGTCSTPKLLK